MRRKKRKLVCLRDDSGIPWWPSGNDSEFSLPRIWVQCWVEELRSHKPNGTV